MYLSFTFERSYLYSHTQKNMIFERFFRKCFLIFIQVCTETQRMDYAEDNKELPQNAMGT